MSWYLFKSVIICSTNIYGTFNKTTMLVGVRDTSANMKWFLLKPSFKQRRNKKENPYYHFF